MPTSNEIYAEAEKLKDGGQIEAAIDKLEALLKDDPAYTLAHSALAVYYGRLARHDEAIRHGLAVIELAPNDAFSYTAMSVTYVRAGKVPEAEDMKARAHLLAGRH